MSVLVIGLTAVLLAVILVLSAITVVHVQDRRLLTCADRVAAAASGVMSADAYYGAGGEERRLLPSPGAAGVEAQRALRHLGTTSCSEGAGVTLVDTQTLTDGVLVTVSAQARLPLLPPFLGELAAPVLMASSSATTR
ncbi:MAG: hypothetical protein L0H81_01150 [Actinomyces sp.]|nr:hypothetical protein [Actinomyces sp.]